MVGMLACDTVNNLTRQHETRTAAIDAIEGSGKEDPPDCRSHGDDASNESNEKNCKAKAFTADNSEGSEGCVTCMDQCLPSPPPGALLLLEAAFSTGSADGGIQAIHTPSGGTLDVTKIVGGVVPVEVSLGNDSSGVKDALGDEDAIVNGECEGFSNDRTAVGRTTGSGGSAKVRTLDSGCPEENPVLVTETGSRKEETVSRDAWYDAGTASNIVRIMEHVRIEASRHGY